MSAHEHRQQDVRPSTVHTEYLDYKSRHLTLSTGSYLNRSYLNKFLPEQVRDGKLPLKVGVLDPQLGEDPVLWPVTWCPDWVVWSWPLSELYGQWNELAVLFDVEQDQRRSHVPVISVAMHCGNALQQRIFHKIHVAVLI